MQQAPQPPDSANPKRANRFRRRGYVIIFAALALVLLVTGGLTTQRSLGQTRSGVSIHATPTSAIAEQPNTGWSRVWSLPISTAQRNGANPFLSWSPAQPQTLYLCVFGQPVMSSVKVAPRSPLLFRSKDGGKTWAPLTLPAPAARCAVYPDPAQAGHIALLNDHGAVYFSADAGDSWQPVLPPADATANGAAFEAIAGGRIYVGAYWTSDLHSWTRWFTGNSATAPLPPLAVDPFHPDTLYTLQAGCSGAPLAPAGASNGVCRSDDGGHSWRYLLSAIHLPGPTPVICLLPTQPGALFVWSARLLTHGADIGTFARSDDGGATWTAQGLPQESQPPVFSPAASCSGHTSFYGSPLGGIDAVRDDGAIYTTVMPGVGGSRPVGVIVYRNGAWQVVAPNPLRVNPTHVPPSVVWLLQPDGHYTLLAISDSALYRYDAQIAG